jgi:hypothetical protein
MEVIFTAHNIRLDDGTLTKPDEEYSMENHPWFVSSRKILEILFPGSKQQYRLADLGCLEGGYAVEFARMGFQVLGVEVRENNIAACNYVKSKTNLPNLSFTKDDAWNIANYGMFDAMFCCGLYYHLDNPKKFLEILSSVTKKVLILQTHFAIGDPTKPLEKFSLPSFIEKRLGKSSKDSIHIYSLSKLTENEGITGRWYPEYLNEESFNDRVNSKWASWDNKRSFWIQREYLLQAIQDVGFDLVLEQYDGLKPNIVESMLKGFYRSNTRGTFIGIKLEK